MVNLPVFLTSAVARTANSSMIFVHSDFFRPTFEAKVSAMAVFVKAFADTAFFFITFMATIAARSSKECRRNWLLVFLLEPH